MKHPRYQLHRRFCADGDSDLVLYPWGTELDKCEKRVRSGTLAQLIEWARKRKNGADLIQELIDGAVFLRR
ncbi:hypothetical protein HQ487_02850 [Candidatus Uhrbacteria bacterium]|nr:hypothetical protein [Candidatus Uhrbacteria bacterium]